MRRSFRDAIVGFSIIGGMVAFAGTMLWLKGVRMGAKTWSVIANFEDASGLSERSPVTYRGILVGSVGGIKVMPESVQAILEIEKADLRLPRPVMAKVLKSSLLGGDVQISLIAENKLRSLNTPLPTSNNCPGNQILCSGDNIQGVPLSSLSSLTIELERLIQDAKEQDILKYLIDSTKQFDRTQKELEELILQAKKEINSTQPILLELHKASSHLNNILGAIDNPRTLDDIQGTATNTRALTRTIDELGNDMKRFMNDEELMQAFRKVTIGLGELFGEIYPSKTNRR